MSRMFKSITGTWNVFVGCGFDCTYCNARKAALTRFRHLARYRHGFKPHLVESELDRKFKPGEFIFVAYMGDISFASIETIGAIRGKTFDYPDTKFLIQSKNPSCFKRWGIPFPRNVYLGTTIESNYDYNLTKAPLPIDRLRGLLTYEHPRKFISIEPIMDFNTVILTNWLELLQPDIVEVGADNYHNHLPEPPGWKIKSFLKVLREICPKVIEKDGLERLMGSKQV